MKFATVLSLLLIGSAAAFLVPSNTMVSSTTPQTEGDLNFNLKSVEFNENYIPSDSTRATTNFANLARGECRQNNLRNAMKMINKRFNKLASWDNPNSNRYSVGLEIVSVDLDIEGSSHPAIEILKTYIQDHKTGKFLEGIVGNNFSSYLRDYDFSVLLPEHNKNKEKFSIPDNFGDLHGKIFKSFVKSESYQNHFAKLPVICLSVSENKTYQRTGKHHPILGFEYIPDTSSLTEQYFKTMGLQVRYFMPLHSVAPLAFYFFGDLLADYTNLELISTISTMETFQKIYRPEIYNSNSVAGECYKPSLSKKKFIGIFLCHFAIRILFLNLVCLSFPYKMFLMKIINE